MVTRAGKILARRLLPATLYRLYRRWRVARLVTDYTTRQVTHTYGDVTLTIELPDGLAEGWYDHDWCALPELERLHAHGLRPGARVFDLGAHQGIVALMLADIVGPAGQVIAVEAEPHNARAADRNRALNDAHNVEVIHAAAAESPGSVLFAEGLNGHVEDGGSRWGKVAVPAVTVDHLAARFGLPDVVLIDVEGFEAHVLAGARETIATGQVAFLVEVHVGHGLDRPPEEVLAVFGSSYRFLVAPTDCGSDLFGEYEASAATLNDRFFLLATPLRSW